MFILILQFLVLPISAVLALLTAIWRFQDRQEELKKDRQHMLPVDWKDQFKK